MSAVIWVIWAHWVADFIMQTDAMARNKSSSNAWLVKHIAMYTLVLLFILSFKWSTLGALLYCLVNGVAHFCTDWCTSRVTGRLWKEQRVHDFFVVIGLDQAIHMTTLVLTLPLLK